MSDPAAGTAEKKAPNKSPRHRARELALQGIYQWRVTEGDDAGIEKQMLAEKNLGRYDKELFSTLLRGALKQHADLEALLSPHLDRPIAEISHVEYAVLILGRFRIVTASRSALQSRHQRSGGTGQDLRRHRRPQIRQRRAGQTGSASARRGIRRRSRQSLAAGR